MVKEVDQSQRFEISLHGYAGSRYLPYSQAAGERLMQLVPEDMDVLPLDESRLHELLAQCDITWCRVADLINVIPGLQDSEVTEEMLADNLRVLRRVYPKIARQWPENKEFLWWRRSEQFSVFGRTASTRSRFLRKELQVDAASFLIGPPPSLTAFSGSELRDFLLGSHGGWRSTYIGSGSEGLRFIVEDIVEVQAYYTSKPRLLSEVIEAMGQSHSISLDGQFALLTEGQVVLVTEGDDEVVLESFDCSPEHPVLVLSTEVYDQELPEWVGVAGLAPRDFVVSG